MIKSGADHIKVLDDILQAANRHPNSRVSKLIHSVEEERSQKNIVLLLIELAEHPEYSIDFGISLRYYLDLFEQLGIGRDIVLNEAGLLLLNSSKVYAKRVDFVQELVERQILTLSNTEKEMVDKRAEDETKSSTVEKPKRSRKRLVEAVADPYEVELLPRKFRKLTEDKRFGGVSVQEKSKVTSSKFYKVESEQYIHPAAWMHSSIVDLENDEDIDSKRNYKLFTYHVEHRYNTLVPDINFRLHFKVKDYMDEAEERLADIDEHNNDAINDLSDWPPLSEEYIEKYLDLENKVLAIGEILRRRKNTKLDGTIADHNINSNALTSLEGVQSLKKSNKSHIDSNQDISASIIESTIACNRDLTTSISESKTDSMQHESGIDSGISLNNTSTIDVSTNEAELLEGSLREGANSTEINSSIEISQSMNSVEKSLLECSSEAENSVEVSTNSPKKDLSSSSLNASDDSHITANTTELEQNDAGLGESASEQNNKNEKLTEYSDSENHNKAAEEAHAEQTSREAASGKDIENGENGDVPNKIRVYLPHLDDEGVYFSDLDDHEHRMLSPKVLTTDVFPCIPNKEKITVLVDDEIKTLLNIPEDEPPITYTMPVQVLPPTPPLVLNIFKFHEKILRRRLLFKLGPEMDLFLQSRSMKRTHCVDLNETRQYRPMKLFSDSPDITIEGNEHENCAIVTDCNIVSDDEGSEDFLGFTEEEQASKIFHRLSRDSGVDADVPSVLNRDSQSQEVKDTNGENVVNGETSEENISQKNGDSCIGSTTENEVVDTVEEATEQVCHSNNIEAATTTPTIGSDAGNRDNSADKEANNSETAPKGNIESSMSENDDDGIDLVDTIQISTNTDVCDKLSNSILLWQDMNDMQGIEERKTKIQKWHEYLQPILAKARERHHFDIFQLGTEIMNELQKPMILTENIASSSITFQDVMANKDESYVSRYFLSTLLLANQNNVKINVNNKCTEKPSSWDDIKLDLLDTKRHTVAIEDNIGIVNSKTLSSRRNTASCNLKKSSIISEAHCGSRTNDNVTVSGEMLNVNLNVVRPLKIIEKLPNTNDDYDSGIFSNEECMS